MKLVIASDLHGSGIFCEKLLEAFDKEKADKMLLLGDILYHGPRNELPDEYGPKKVIELLNKRKDILMCVRGNCDAEVDQMVLDFPIMSDYIMLDLDGITLFATHGHIYNEYNVPPMGMGDVLLNGHTHVPKCTEYENFVYMNPGSVTMPKNNSYHGYILYENKEFIWKELDGSVKDTYSFCKINKSAGINVKKVLK